MSWFMPRAHRASVVRHSVGALPIAALVLALGGCGGSMKVATDFDPSANFVSLKTYSWRAGTPLANQLQSQRVVDAVDAQLKAKGLTRVDSGGDISVTYHAAADKEMNVQSFQTGGYYSCWGGCSTSTTVTHETVGTLVVDMVDAKTNKMLWRGSATDTVSEDPKENQAKIAAGVKEMFTKFPPKAKS